MNDGLDPVLSRVVIDLNGQQVLPSMANLYLISIELPLIIRLQLILSSRNRQ